MLRLVIEDDEGKTIVVPLIRDEITIGRKEGNIIRLTERNVSRRHARLVRTGDAAAPAVLVEDLDSYNGVKLNGDSVTGRCTMRPGDLIQIGDYSLALRVDAPGKDSAEENRIESVPTAVHQISTDVLPAEEQGRLVVVSSNLAGETYYVTRREAIIGRTSENDVVVNHRSISRNHAKVIVRDGTFTIIDLASSNGVRVNNEAFGTTSLVNGDIIQLGHVKLRYVAPGDDYVFSRADIDDVELDSGPSTGKLVLVALLLVAVALAAFILVGRNTEPKPEPKKPTTQVKPPPPKRPSAIEEIDIDALMQEGRTHLKGEKWGEAANVFGRVLQTDPNRSEAKDGRRQAQAETKNKSAYEVILNAQADDQWDEAHFRMQDFPKESIYAPRLEPHRKKIQTGYANGELERGKALIRQDDLPGARQMQKALAQKPFALRQAKALAEAIAAAEAAAAAPADQGVTEPPKPKPKPDPGARRRRPPRPVAEKPRARDPVKPKPKAAADAAEYEQLMRKALGLMARGARAEAAKALNQAAALRPQAHTPHQRLCAIYQAQGRAKQALKHCRLWLTLETNGAYKAQIRRRIDLLEAELQP